MYIFKLKPSMMDENDKIVILSTDLHDLRLGPWGSFLETNDKTVITLSANYGDVSDLPKPFHEELTS